VQDDPSAKLALRVADLLGPLASLDHPLGALTTYRVGGTAAVFATLGTEAEVEAATAAVAETGIEVLVLGKGSNIVVADTGFRGLAVQLAGDFAAIEIDAAGGSADAGGAVAYPVLARRTAAAGLTGLEWAVGVPGSVGGAVRMNAGGHGSQTASALVEATVADLASGLGIRTLSRDQLALGYRSSGVRDEDAVLTARFALDPEVAEACLASVSEVVAWRRAHQPGGQNAGSVFINPDGDSAGRIVEAAGLKGFRLGSAQVSPKHANFIQADPGGSGDDVFRLIAEVRRLVEERSGICLAPEVHLIGATL
jgi:UDP-N-acetylmuramate dehydrogenase